VGEILFAVTAGRLNEISILLRPRRQRTGTRLRSPAFVFRTNCSRRF